jgi:hypothetical protein
MNDNSDTEIEIVKEEKKPQSLMKILIIMFLALVLIGALIIGGLKLYKQYKNREISNIKQSLPLQEPEEINNSYVEVLALSQKIPAPSQLEIPKNLEKPMLIKAPSSVETLMLSKEKNELDYNNSEEIDYSSLPHEERQNKSVKSEKEPDEELNEKLNEMVSFKELEEAIVTLKIKRVEDEIIVGERSYKEHDSLGDNFIIRKIYPNGNVKIFNIKENYSRRFSL